MKAGAPAAERFPASESPPVPSESPPPDLAAVGAPLAPRFPREESMGTRVVLYPGARSELWASWHLDRRDLMRAGVDFPADGGPAIPVLRLMPLTTDGAGPIDERRLSLLDPWGEGERLFRPGPTPGRYRAELGLTNPRGGWLLLARSNTLENAAGLDFPERLPVSGTRRSAAAGRPVHDAMGAPDSVRLYNRPGADRAVPPASGATANPPGATGQILTGRNGELDRAMTEMAIRSAPNRAGETAAAPASVSPAALPPDASPAVSIGSGLPPLVYGQPAPALARPVIEAELLIHGWASPNSEIDLFGHHYRVGPGGRFQVRIRVEDPELLHLALARCPPQLPSRDVGD